MTIQPTRNDKHVPQNSHLGKGSVVTDKSQLSGKA